MPRSPRPIRLAELADFLNKGSERSPGLTPAQTVEGDSSLEIRGFASLGLALSDELVGFVRRLRQHTDHPIAVGFGISGPAHVRAVWDEADAAVVGSAIVHRIEKRLGHSDMAASVGELIRWMRGTQLEPEPQHP